MAFTPKSDDIKGLEFPGLGSKAMAKVGFGTKGFTNSSPSTSTIPNGALLYTGNMIQLSGSTLVFNP